MHRQSPNNAGTIHLKWEVTTEEEMKVAAWREENTTWEWDQDRFDELLADVGDIERIRVVGEIVDEYNAKQGST